MNAALRAHRHSRQLSVALALAAGLLISGPAEGRIIKIEITSKESPTFEARAFGSVGPYEKIRGKAYGEIDPADPRNALIADIRLAPTTPNGKVAYSMDVFILKPIDLTRSNGKLFIDINNRGTMRWDRLNDGGSANNPTKAADAGTGFLMNDGYIIAGNGWDVQVMHGGHPLAITAPVAKNPDGSPVTGPSYEYINFDNATSMRYRLAYPAATLDKSKATLTVRARLDDEPATVPQSGWEFVDDKTIRLLPAGTPFKQSHVYEFTYVAKDPVVAGVGLAATRDFVSFLRHAANDDSGNPNPLAGRVRHTYSFAVSQSARYINDFQTFGFNEDEQGRRVIDGVLNWIGGGSGANINYRFAQTGRTERNRQHHLYPEALFPFAYPVLKDHLSGKMGGRSQRCSVSKTCPNAFEVNSANEYWVKAASLLHADTKGNDLPDPSHVRFYLLSGLQHGTGNDNDKGVCQQFTNGIHGEPALRALLVALDQWVSRGIAPPASSVPRRADNTAVFAVPRPGFQTGIVPQDRLGWPTIPGVTYNGLTTTRYLLDFGPMSHKGILSNYPPSVSGRPAYAHFVSRVDKDGNEVAGIRLPPVEAPIATTTGWALRRAGFGENDGCEAAGQHIPFKTTKAKRVAAGDPRLSLEERYQDHDGYVKAVTRAATKLEKRRLLLPEDVKHYIEQAQASAVLK
jgi:Alpha/beta hydrolase domain